VIRLKGAMNRKGGVNNPRHIVVSTAAGPLMPPIHDISVDSRDEHGSGPGKWEIGSLSLK
jgi:hypothetical protein